MVHHEFLDIPIIIIMCTDFLNVHCNESRKIHITLKNEL